MSDGVSADAIAWAARLSATSSCARRSSRSSSCGPLRREAPGVGQRQPRGRDVVEHVHPPHDRAARVADGRRGVLDGAAVNRLAVLDRLPRRVRMDRGERGAELLRVGEAPLEDLVDHLRMAAPRRAPGRARGSRPTAAFASDSRPRQSLTITPMRLDAITPSRVWRFRRMRAASWWLRAVRAIWGASAPSRPRRPGTGFSRAGSRARPRRGAAGGGCPSAPPAPPRRASAGAAPPRSRPRRPARPAGRSPRARDTSRGHTTGPPDWRAGVAQADRVEALRGEQRARGPGPRGDGPTQ